MNIIFCLGEMNKGGAERVVCNLANYYAIDNNVSLIVTSLCKKEYDFNKNVKIYNLSDYIKNSNNFLIRNYKRLSIMKKILKETNADVVFAFLQEPIGRMLLLKLVSPFVHKIPLIVSVRIDPKTAFKGWKRKLSLPLYNLADGFVFQTNEAQRFFNKRIQKRSTVIGNPINPIFFSNKNVKKDNTIISVGRLTEQKNYPVMIRGFKKVLKRFPNYKLKIFGDGPLKDSLIKMIDDESLSNNVFIMGNTDDIKTELEKSKIFVITSNYEGMSNALMEAMALGLPCISTDSAGGGAKTLIKDGENGFLIEVNDYNALSDRLTELLCDDELYNGISLKSKLSMNKYEPTLINKQWNQYMYKIIGKGE